MINTIQANVWWILPLIMYPLKILIEVCVGGILKRENQLALRRIGLELCFLSLGFYALALTLKSSKFYVEFHDIQGIAACISIIILLILYFLAVLAYKFGEKKIALSPFRKLKWFLAASFAGVLALVISLFLF